MNIQVIVPLIGQILRLYWLILLMTGILQGLPIIMPGYSLQIPRKTIGMVMIVSREIDINTIYYSQTKTITYV